MPDPTPYPREHDEPASRDWSRLNQWVLWLGLAAALIWMYFLHEASLLEMLPFLALLMCPLMDLFGHRHRTRTESEALDRGG